jgi:dTDP-4-dehydrorhamnose reductase
LGESIVTHLRSQGLAPLTPSRAELDLAGLTRSAAAKLLREGGVTHAVICAAISDVDRCAADIAYSRAINVEGVARLIDACVEAGVTPVFYSSDYVFAGDRDSYREEDPCRPTTEYGRQKLEIENYLRERAPGHHLIFRFAKLMSMDSRPRSILADAAARLRKGEPFLCPEDQWITPVYCEDVAQALTRSIESGLHGIYHLATRKQLTRLELVRLVAREIGVESPELIIRPVRVRDLPAPIPRPCHNTLDAGRFEREADFRFRELGDGLPRL